MATVKELKKRYHQRLKRRVSIALREVLAEYEVLSTSSFKLEFKDTSDMFKIILVNDSINFENGCYLNKQGATEYKIKGAAKGLLNMMKYKEVEMKQTIMKDKINTKTPTSKVNGALKRLKSAIRKGAKR